MLQLAKPKLIICDFSIVGTVQGALQQLQMNRTILTFDGSAEGVQNIETLFDENETDVESFEYGIPNTILYSLSHKPIIKYIIQLVPLYQKRWVNVRGK